MKNRTSHIRGQRVRAALPARTALCAALCCASLVWAVPSARAADPGVSAAPVLNGLFSPDRTVSRAQTAELTPALDGLTRGTDDSRSQRAAEKSVEAFAAKIWYAGAILLTADRVVRSMDSVLESAQIEGRNHQRFGLDLSDRGVGMVLRFERSF